MPVGKERSRWEVVGKSVRGASHVRQGLVNQDSIRWYPRYPQPGFDAPIILAVSDGHGSARCFRSDVGAKTAVDVSIDTLRQFLEATEKPESPESVIKDWAKEKLPRELARRWREAVEEDLKNNPFSPEQVSGLGEKGKPLETNPALAYGATLLNVIVTDSYILYLQLGDGDILTVSENGGVTRPLAPDERLFANETTSLCTPDAWKDFRVSFRKLSEKRPAMILVSTDGYSNSFQDEGSFLKVASDIYGLLKQPEGTNKVWGSMEEWLNTATTQGSGDDITLGLVYQFPLPDVAAETATAPAKGEAPPQDVLTIRSSIDLKDSLPYQRIAAFLARHGTAALEDKGRRAGMLRDLFGNEPDELNALQIALEENALRDLQTPDAPSEQRLKEITGRISKTRRLSKQAAGWAVDTLAVALGILPASQAEARLAPEKTGLFKGWFGSIALLVLICAPLTI